MTTLMASAVRLLREWRLAVVVVALLALGVGANTASVSLGYTALYRPPPFSDPASVLHVWGRNITAAAPGRSIATAREALAWREAVDSFVDMSVVETCSRAITACLDVGGADGKLLPVNAAFATADLFEVLGRQPALGVSTQGVARDGHDVFLSHEYWMRMFGGEAEGIGRRLRVRAPNPADDGSYTVRGVLPADFRFEYPRDVDVWILKDWDWVRSLPADAFRLQAIVRVRAPSERARLESALQRASAELRRSARGYEQRGVWTEGAGERWAPASSKPFVLALLLGGAVFALTCSSVVLLWVTRQLGRRQERAVRAVLGATRGDLLREDVCDGAVLGALGGVAAIVASMLAIGALKAWLPANVTRASDLAFDVVGLAVVVGSCAVLVAVGCVLPSLMLVGTEIDPVLKADRATATASRTRRVLERTATVVQVCIATALLVAAIRLVGELNDLSGRRLGFTGDAVWAAEVRLSPREFASPEAALAFQGDVERTLCATPGVRRCAVASGVPLTEPDVTWQLNALGSGPEGGALHPMRVRLVSWDYLQMLGLALEEGRYFARDDQQGHDRLAIVSRAAGTSLFGERPWLGREMKLHLGGRRTRIVGVVGDVRESVFDDRSVPTLYVLSGSHYFLRTWILAEGQSRSAIDEETIRTAIRGVNDGVSAEIQPFSRIKSAALGEAGFYSKAMLVSGVIAGLVAAIAIHRGVRRAILARWRELAIRVAVGASQSSVARLVAGSVVTDIVLGAMGGWVISIWVTHGVLAPLLPGHRAIASTDLGVAAAGAVVLAGIAAAIVPLMGTARASIRDLLAGERNRG